MKIRTSFVSNSSSSSYIITCTKKTHDQTLAKLAVKYPETSQFWREEVSIENKKLGAEDIVNIYVFLSTEDNICQIGGYTTYTNNEEEYRKIESRFYKYYDLISKSEAIIQHID